MRNDDHTDRRKRPGRPATGRDPVTAIRLSEDLRTRVDKWAQSQPDKPSRSEAVRRLVDRALADEREQPGRASISVKDLNASNDD